MNTKLPGRRLNSRFQIKDNSKKEHEHNIVYHVNCCQESYENNGIGGSGRRLVERVKDHNGRDNKSHVLKHSIEKRHAEVELSKVKKWLKLQ